MESKKLYAQRVNNNPLFSSDKDYDVNEMKNELTIDFLHYLNFVTIKVRGEKVSGKRLFGLCGEKEEGESFADENISYEIFELIYVDKVVEKYDPQKGASPITYLYTCLERKIKKDISDEDLKRSSGFTKGYDVKRAKKILRHINDLCDEKSNLDDVFEIVAQAEGISKKKVIDIYNLRTESFYYEDGTEKDIVDSNAFIQFRYEDIDTCISWLDKIDSIFESKQARTKPILSKLITARIVKEGVLCKQEILDFAKQKSFFNIDIYDDFVKTQKVPKDKEIGKEFGKDGSSISRMFTTFEDELDKVIKGIINAAG